MGVAGDMDSPHTPVRADAFIGAVPRGDSFLRKVLKTLWVLLNLCVLVALPLAAWDMHRHDMHPHFIAWFVAGVFVLLAVPITFYEVAQHLEHYRAPRLQRHVIRILFMVPIYAVDCWLALRFKDQTIYFDTIRECYEAYVVYNFYAYCTVYLEAFCVPGLEAIVARKPQQRHIFPISALCGAMPPMAPVPGTNSLGSPFLRLCRHGVINYVVTRPLTTMCAFVAQAAGVYGDGDFTNPLVAYPYLAVINNVSQAWAMYCLILFYRALHEELAPIRPFYKFLTVKAVVFLSFWQGQALLLATKLDMIDSLRGRVEGDKNDDVDYENESSPWANYDDASFATALQEFAICVEMFFAAIAHAYAFPVSEYDGGRGGEHGRGYNSGGARAFGDNVRDMFDLRDVYHDVVTFSESNKDEFWAEVNFRYRAFIGIFTGATPLKSEYSRVRDENDENTDRVDEESARVARATRFGRGGGTVSELRGESRRSGGSSASGAFSERELRSMGRGRRGPGGSDNELGAEVALFAGVSPKGSNRGEEGRAFARVPNAGAFSMPGVSAIPGVDREIEIAKANKRDDNSARASGSGGVSVAPLEREGRAGSKKFTLE